MHKRTGIFDSGPFVHAKIKRMSLSKKNRGFTLIELMVVVGIIAVLLSIILFSISQARENSRNKQRISDIASIEFALTLYKEKNRAYPVYDGGVELGVGEPIDAELAPFWPDMKGDPINEGGSNGSYGYWYDSSFNCGGTVHRVVLVRSLEGGAEGNYDEVCGGGGSSFNFEPDGFIKRAHAGGGYSQGSYYSQGTYYSQSTYYAQSVYFTEYSEASYYNEASYSSQTLDLSGDDTSGLYIIILD